MYRYGHAARRFAPTIRIAGRVIGVLTVLASIACLALLTLYAGFDHQAEGAERFRQVLHGIQLVFALDVIYDLAFARLGGETARRPMIKWILDIAVLLSLLPAIVPHPHVPWLLWLDRLLFSHYYFYTVLGIYGFIALCYGLMRITARRTSPSLILASSFLVMILTGSLLLMMPRCTYHGISYADSLFISTSAVCITGLTPVDVATTFTPLGQLILGILAQVGALGVMTFTSFFALFFSGTTSIYSQLLIRDMIYSKSMNALIPTLLYILGFTLAVELMGAVWIFFTVPAAFGMDLPTRVGFALFQSMSSFCNAGFCTVPDGMSNPLMMQGGQGIYIATSTLVLAGAIGFPILVNFKDILADRFRRLRDRLLRRPACTRRVHLYSLNTKLVLVTYLSILAVSTLAFLALEYDNTLRGMSLGDKVVQSVFNSLTPRSAGFASVNPADFLPATLILVVAQMWIGGGAQSMAGGIKVNTFATMVLNLRAIVTGQHSPVAFGRRIAQDSIRRAMHVIALSILAVILFAFALFMLEPGLGMRQGLFEVVSAVFTVGSSLGATAKLGAAAKGLLCVAMFLGRVGIISLLVGLAGSRPDVSRHYPDENVIIN